MSLTLLGQPPVTFAHEFEPPVLLMESSPGNGSFKIAPFLQAFTIRRGSNTNLDTAEIRVSLGENYDLNPSPDDVLRDWQVRTAALNAENIFEIANQRRVQIRTARQWPKDDWVLFTGFVERITLGWSGSGSPKRWATLQCVSVIAAADRERSQTLCGQWRRCYNAELDVITNGEVREFETQRICSRVHVPLVFNPGGKPNCDPRPLMFADGSNVYIPTDVENPTAIPWTVAKMLRYIHWASLQGASPTQFDVDHAGDNRYDQVGNSLSTDVQSMEKNQGWTNQGIRHANLWELTEWQGEKDGKKLVDRPPNEVANNVRVRAMLSALPDVAIDTFSVIEAFAYLADRANMLMSYDYVSNDNAGVTPRVRFHIRGDRSPETPGGKSPIFKGTTSGVYFYVGSDGLADGSKTEKQLLAETNCVDGAITFDTAAMRSNVYVPGDASVYELTVELRPGWKPDSWWDVDPSDSDAVKVALARLSTAEWAERYAPPSDTPDAMNLYRRVGRNWVLNEDGAFTPGKYRRAAGPWKKDADWEPYPFHLKELADLNKRRDFGWSTRRRRFLPTTALDQLGVDVLDSQPSFGVLVQISFDSGFTWLRMPLSTEVASDRCGVLFTANDLRTIEDPSKSGLSFVTAYIKGRLRVRVTASIEGDDCVFGFAQAEQQRRLSVNTFSHFIDRRGQYRRALRGEKFGGKNALYADYGCKLPGDLEDTQTADLLAQRMLDEVAMRRISGDVTIPYLLRPQAHKAWPTYNVGDEVQGVKTGEATTYIEFAGSDRDKIFYPRIVGMDYAWAGGKAGDVSTTLHMEEAPIADANTLAARMLESADAVGSLQRRTQRAFDERAL